MDNSPLHVPPQPPAAKEDASSGPCLPLRPYNRAVRCLQSDSCWNSPASHPRYYTQSGLLKSYRRFVLLERFSVLILTACNVLSGYFKRLLLHNLILHPNPGFSSTFIACGLVLHTSSTCAAIALIWALLGFTSPPGQLHSPCLLPS